MSIVVTDIVFQKEVLFVKYWLIDQKSVYKWNYKGPIGQLVVSKSFRNYPNMPTQVKNQNLAYEF